MKNLFFALTVLFTALSVSAQNKTQAPAATLGPVEEIKWVSVNELPALMAAKPKKVFIDVYTAWCGPCKMMMNSTFKDPEIIKYVNQNFYAVKFNAEGKDTVNFKGYVFANPGYDPAKAASRNSTHELTLAIAPVQTRIAYPTLVYFDEQLNILAPIQGYFPAGQLKPVLTYFNEGKYKEGIDLQAYLNAAGGKP